jgi:hypothetical protein
MLKTAAFQVGFGPAQDDGEMGIGRQGDIDT